MVSNTLLASLCLVLKFSWGLGEVLELPYSYVAPYTTQGHLLSHVGQMLVI